MSSIGSIGGSSTSLLNLRNSQKSLQSSMQRLSSGLRINSASDDPSGLAISEKITAQLRGTNQASDNVSDAMSMLDTAQGALGAVEENVQRVRELSVRASNATLTDSDREAIQQEIDQRKESIQDLTDRAQFNKKDVLKGGKLEVQSGADAGETSNVELPDTRGVLGSIDVTTQDGAQEAIKQADDALETITNQQSQLGASINGLESRNNALQNTATNQAASRSRIQDANVASAAADKATFSVQTQANISVIKQQQEQAGQLLSLLA